MLPFCKSREERLENPELKKSGSSIWKGLRVVREVRGIEDLSQHSAAGSADAGQAGDAAPMDTATLHC